MKPFCRLILGLLLGVLASTGLYAASTGPIMSVSGIAVAPGAGAPGDTVTLNLTFTNSAAATTAPTNQNDFPAGGSANVTMTFTHLATGNTFTRTLTVTSPALIVENNGTGLLSGNFTLPTQTLEAGAYRATAVINSVTGGSTAAGGGGFGNTTSVLSVTGQPDLQITALDYQARTDYIGGTIIPMTITYRNNSVTNGVQNVPYVPGLNGFPSSVRIQIVLSSNPTFGDADDFQLTINTIGAGTISGSPVDNVSNAYLPADNSLHTFTWQQILPGNITGSFYVLAKIDSLGALAQNNPAALSQNGNDIWVGNTINPAATLINLIPSNFPTVYLASHGAGASTTASGYSDNPSISADGRYVAFASDATNLVSASAVGGADTNGWRDIFLFDSQTSTSRRLSLSQQSAQGNGASNNPAISADGRYVAFASDANNLVVGDTNGFSDIFVVDALTGLIARISGANATGGQANNPSFKPAISQNGRYIVFESTATNLTATATAVGVSHIYLYDRDKSGSGAFDTAGNTGTYLVDVDVTTPANPGNANAIQAAISSDGSTIAFSSKATNLVTPATTAGRQHVYIRARTSVVSGATSGIRDVSVVNATAAEGNDNSQTPALNSDGHYIVFASLATNLVAGDTNGVSDVFVYDTAQPVGAPIVRRMSVTASGLQGTDPSGPTFQLGSINPTISADGRYVAFASLDDNLTSGDTNAQFKAADANQALDIFVHDRDVNATGTFDTGTTTTTMVSVNPFGYQTNGLLGVASTAASNIYPAISANGRFVAFPTDAENTAGLAFGTTNLLPLDSNGVRDVFLFDRRTTATVTPATPPTVSITSPGNATSSLVNTTVTIIAGATAPVGFVSSVQFYVNGTSLGTSTATPYSAPWTPTAVGTYNLSAIVTDSFGNIGVSPNVSVVINASPSVGITSPVTGTSVTLGGSVAVTASAAPANPGGTIAQVQFFANGVALGADTTAPYATTWIPAATGTYTLTAITTESVTVNGVPQTIQSTSPAVTVTVTTAGGGGGGGSITPPTVSLAAPPATTSVNAQVTLTATAAAGSATTSITNVQFYAGNALIGTATTAPYTVVWVPQALGTFSITAKVTDSTGNTAVSTAFNVVVSGTLAVALTSPASSATISVNTPQSVSAVASMSNGTVSSVQFFANGLTIGTASAFPYTVSWTPTTLGTYSLTAVATDNTGAKATSVAVVVTVSAGTAAAVSISSPAQGSTIPAGLPQVIVANASAGTGTITKVDFFANGVSLGTAPAFPYNFTWTPAGPGPVALTAVVTDSLGNQTTSAAVNVTVSALSAGAPTVSITAPSAGASLQIGALATITATATDSDGLIASVKFYANGVLIDSDSTYPYSASFTPVATGNYSLTAVATDDGGNVTVSTPVLVTVSGGTAPSVAIIAPVSGATFDLNTSQTILATASANSGTIVGVQFFVNGTSIGTSVTFPFAAAWKPTAVGTYSLTARATDSLGNFTDSAPVLATVTPGSTTLPKVALTASPSGTSVTVNTPVFLSANAVDPDGVVANVEFYVNDKLVGSKATSPYFAAWVPTTVGTFTIKAIVTDNAGNRVTSAPSIITTTPQNGALPVTDLDFNNPAVDSPTGATPPVIDPLVPVKVSYGSKLIISAAAVKDDGTITNVQFFANGVNIGTLTAAPYFTTYQLNTLSDVTLTALVSDSAGNNVFTNPILISTQASTQAAGSVVTLVSPTNGATYVTGGQITFSATHNFGNVTPPKIDFYIDGQQFTTVTSATGTGANAPYQYVVGLTRAGTYIVHAVGRQGNVTTVSAPARIVVTSSRAPAVNITNPVAGPSYTVGTSLTISANASSPTSLISSVQFFVNGAAFSSKNTVPYTATWNPGAAGVYTLTALATDDSGNQTLSAPVVLNFVANSAPTVSMSNPANGTQVSAGTVVSLTASAADSDGTVTSVRFLANGNSVGNAATAVPFTVTWTPSAAGSYSVVAQATDNSGNVTTSAPITVVVGSNVSPVVTLTSPGSGATVRTGSPTTLIANASDADGLVAGVQFFANGAAVGGAVTAVNPQGGYRTPWTPAAEGIYRLTAVVTDNAGATTTSATTIVLAANSSTSATDTVYAGSYSGGSEAGRFAVISVKGKSAAFIAYSTTTPAKTYFYSGLSVDGTGGFSLTDSTGRSMITGSVNDTGVSGTLDANRVLFIGPIAFPTGSVSNGYYTGNITGRPSSMLAAIVGADGSVMVYVADGSFQTVGSGSVDGTGSFNVSVTGGARFTGKIDPATGFLTGSLSGANGGAVMATTSSGVSFSDGFLRNLSTRGQVGTGGNILIAGFVVGGAAPKQVLVRAIGPTLSGFGLTGVLADPQLQLFNSGGALVVANNNWGGAGDVINASLAVGAFPLASGSLDAVILATLSPGAYTAQVSGVGNTTGLALVELYDVDSLQPFSTQKVMNVATRGVVGTGQAQLIAGFVVSGNTSKKVLIRGVGPTLAAAPFNVTGVLTDPVLRLVRSDNLIIRENDNWETGNDVALINDAATKVGAFPLAIGGKDSAILLNLPPGTYSAQVTGSGNTTGVALIEVYEVP